MENENCCLSKIFSNLLLLLVFSMLFEFPSNAQTPKSFEFSVSNLVIEDITTDSGEKYCLLKYEEANYIHDVGKPKLPVKYYRFIIPFDQDVDEFEFTQKDTSIIMLTEKVYPVQEDTPTMLYQNKKLFDKPMAEVYDKENPYPGKIAEVINHGYFDANNHIVTIAVYPFQYYPALDKIVFVEKLKFKMKLKSNKNNLTSIQKRKAKNAKKYSKMLEQMVDNPEEIGLFGNSGLVKESKDKNTTSIGPLPAYEYVVITSNSLSSSFDQFVGWKKRKGLDIGIVTTEQIYQHYDHDPISGIYDNAGAIRHYLYDSYQDGTVWALLGGDEFVVPVRYGAGYIDCNWGYGSYYRIPADQYFADFDGDWDVDGDDRYGEPSGISGDDVDYNPEIFVGRLLCSNSQEIQRWTTKILKYEQNPGNGETDYLTSSFIFQADQMQNGNQAEYVAARLPGTFSHTIYEEVPGPYTTTTPTFPTGNDIISEFNNHHGLWSWFVHGTPVEISVASVRYDETPRYVVNTIDSWQGSGTINETGNGLDNMDNINYPSIIYSISCTNTPLDDFNPSGDWPNGNFGEAFTVNSNAGGPAFLGNTRYGWVYYSYLIYGEFANLIAAGGNDPVSGESLLHLGVAELISKSNSSSIGYGHYLNLSHNLIGCPETRLWTTIPSTYSNVTITDDGYNILVRSFVSGSTICASSAADNGASYFSVIENVSTASFETDVRPLNITITKTNYLPYLTTLTNEYPPVISHFTQTPDPICLGSQGYVYAHLSQGTEPVTYSWQGYNFPQNITITPMGQKCKVTYSDLAVTKDNHPIIQVPYYIECTVSNSYGSNTNTYVPHLSSICEPGGCPTLAYESESGRIDDNTVLINSPSNPDSIVVDYYMLNYLPTVKNGNLEFIIHEPEKEHTWIDEIELWELKANKDEFIAVTDEGEFISFKQKKREYKYVLNDTLDVTSELETNDDKFYVFMPGDLLRIEKDKSKSSSIIQESGPMYATAIGVKPPPGEKVVAGNIYIKRNGIKYETIMGEDYGIGGFYFRDNISTVAKRVGNLTEDDAVEIIFNNVTEIDYFVLTNNLKTVKSEKLELVKSAKGNNDIENKIRKRDGNFAELLPGEEMNFAYETKYNFDKKEKIKHVLKVVGKYEKSDDNKLVAGKVIGDNLVSGKEDIPKENKLYDNYPNPFNPTTLIKYELKEPAEISLKVFDSLGRLVNILEESSKPGGRYEIAFDGKNLSSGLYFYQLTSDKFSFTKKMLLVK